ncbi:hypothetical protein AVEN_138400-1 [Araneus ventricosus]|uniref:Uncharacterized protein n=1 Tax=Araneus ventricosus TaxID=182803 RepID=A0A4Y2SFY2_ARAVE|nr:hypothetical protein AVEN_138400-1 [Araneus ventricosus]
MSDGLSDPSLSCYQENRASLVAVPLMYLPKKISVFSSLAPPFYSLVLLLENGPKKCLTNPSILARWNLNGILAPYLFWACPSVTSGFSCSR